MADVVDIIDSSGSSLFDYVLTVCLYLGAAFQLICIFSVVVLPEREDQNVDNSVDTNRVCTLCDYSSLRSAI